MYLAHLAARALVVEEGADVSEAEANAPGNGLARVPAVEECVG